MTHTAETLLEMDRKSLILLASRMGIRVAGRPSALLMNDILVRQGEIAGRAVTPLEVRVANLEDDVARLDKGLVEQGAMMAEFYSALAQLAEEHGVQLHSALKVLALKYRTRMTLARFDNDTDPSKL